MVNPEDRLSALALDDRQASAAVAMHLDPQAASALACVNTSLALTPLTGEATAAASAASSSSSLPPSFWCRGDGSSVGSGRGDIANPFLPDDASMPSHEGDALQYALAAEARSRPARTERGLPLCRWLAAPGERGGETVALVSYPRSGNSMLRGMLEHRLGLYTGSDTRPDRTLSRALRDQWGMAGEGVVDPALVHVVKSHWPERRGWRPVPCQRAVLLVRNPFDAIDSYFNMCLTNTHHLSLTESAYDRFSGTWEAMMVAEAKLWARFHAYWLAAGVPLFVVRYEDLRARPATLDALVQWLMAPPASSESSQSSSPSSAGGKGAEEPELRPSSAPVPAKGAEQPATATTATNAATTATAATASTPTPGTPYTPRVGGVGKALRRFEARGDQGAELLAAVVAGAGAATLRGFGYHPDPVSAGGSGFPGEVANRRPNYEAGATVRPGRRPKARKPNKAQGAAAVAATARDGAAGSVAAGASAVTVLNKASEVELRGPDNKFGR